jgi:general secretion pathway protein H
MPRLPRSLTTRRAPASAGFSLVEILVVLAVMAIATSVVLLNAGPATPSLASEADRFARHLTSARDLALIRNRAVQVSISESGYEARIETRTGWGALDRGGEIVPWQAGTGVVGPPETFPQVVVFDSIGISAPARITLERDGRTTTVAIDTSGNIVREDARGA